MKEIRPIAFFRSPLQSKFGIPRQSGVVSELRGRVVFVPEYRSADAVRGIDDYDYLWLVWGFSANRHEAAGMTVRPPRLGGNRRMGVFATRSPYRPNGLGLSSVRLLGVEREGKDAPVLIVGGADLMDGTPIYDVKPYLPYADAHPDARGGMTDGDGWRLLRVEGLDIAAPHLTPEELHALELVLANDPRPRYQDDPGRVYGMPFAGLDVKFCVSEGTLRILEIATFTPRKGDVYDV